MKKYLLIILFLFFSNHLQAQDNLKFYVQKALTNNLQLNAERKNFESAKQSKNISKWVFTQYYSSGDQTSSTSTNRTNKSGSSLADQIWTQKVQKF